MSRADNFRAENVEKRLDRAAHSKSICASTQVREGDASSPAQQIDFQFSISNSQANDRMAAAFAGKRSPMEARSGSMNAFTQVTINPKANVEAAVDTMCIKQFEIDKVLRNCTRFPDTKRYPRSKTGIQFFDSIISSISRIGEKPYACPVCPRAFNQRVVLREHIRSHHSGADPTYENTMTPYYCTVCGSTFGTPSEIIQHLIEHSNANTISKRQPTVSDERALQAAHFG